LFSFLDRGKGRKWSRFLDSDTRDGGAVSEDRLEQINHRIWDLRRRLRDAIGAGLETTLVQVLNQLARQGDQIQAAIVAWVELLEVLVQDAEQRSGAGTGALKASEVKQVAHFLLWRENRDLPHGDDIINPILGDLVADWTIDIIVRVTNRNNLWVPDTAAEEPWWRKVLMWLAAALNRFLNALMGFFKWISGPLARLVNPSGALPPRLR